MDNMMKISGLILSLTLLFFISGCAPEVGSDKWCASLKEKPKADWSSNELADFSKNCIFK